MKIVALIKKASDWEYSEIRVFDSWEEMINYMMETYREWIVTFIMRKEFTCDKREIDAMTTMVGESDYYIKLIIYDDYIE